MRCRLLSQEIRYKMKDTFYFSARGHFQRRLRLCRRAAARGRRPQNDLVVRCTHVVITNRSPLDITCLLS